MMEVKLFSSILGILLFVCISFIHVEGKDPRIECIVNEAESADDPNNIYKCDAASKCCKEGGLPTCCFEKETTVAVWDQIQLWGTLGGLILVLAIFMCCCRHDGDYCCNRKDGKFCCGLCTKKHNYAPEEEENGAIQKEYTIEDELDNCKPAGYINRDVYDI